MTYQKVCNLNAVETEYHFLLAVAEGVQFVLFTEYSRLTPYIMISDADIIRPKAGGQIMEGNIGEDHSKPDG